MVAFSPYSWLLYTLSGITMRGTQREMYRYCNGESFDIMTPFDWGLGSLVSKHYF